MCVNVHVCKSKTQFVRAAIQTLTEKLGYALWVLRSPAPTGPVGASIVQDTRYKKICRCKQLQVQKLTHDMDSSNTHVTCVLSRSFAGVLALTTFAYRSSLPNHDLAHGIIDGDGYILVVQDHQILTRVVLGIACIQTDHQHAVLWSAQQHRWRQQQRWRQHQKQQQQKTSRARAGKRSPSAAVCGSL